MKTLRLLVSYLEDSGIGAMEIDDEGMSLRILMHAGGAINPTSQGRSRTKLEEAHTQFVHADVAGTFLVTHPSRAEPFVRRGNAVSSGQMLGLVKTGVLYKAVLAEKAANVRRLMASHGDVVEPGSPLFEMEVAQSNVDRSGRRTN
jgi:acetyl-CoA carboxylase biotin carboxyl carrier protein